MQLPIDKLRQIACHFFSREKVSVLVIAPTQAGFSGSITCILNDPKSGRKHVLKQLPRLIPINQIHWTHALAAHVNVRGHQLLPTAIDCNETRRSPSISTPKVVTHADGTLWQCLEYIDGQPLEAPRHDQVELAITSLADIHNRAAGFHKPPHRTLSGWERRVQQLRQLVNSKEAQPERCNTSDQNLMHLRELQIEFLQLVNAPGLRDTMHRLTRHTMTTVHQPVLRDCWWDHVIFSGSKDLVKGIIDMDAAGWDDPAVDISRLLGSWQLESRQNDAQLFDLWPNAFKSYTILIEAGTNFPSRVQLYHDTAIISGLQQWFTWLLTENQTFTNMQSVLKRVTLLLGATPAALKRLQQFQPKCSVN